MRRLFRMMSDQVQGTGQQLQTWWATLSPDPRSWLPFTWVLAGIVVVIVLTLLLRPRRRAGARRPELLISHGELRVAGAAAADAASSLQAPANAVYELGMTVSNLSASPVQLLELAVRTNRASAATTAEVAAVLPPHGAVDVAAELQDAAGDEGALELFVYVPDMPPKTFRVRARLLWEPWNARYRVLPLDQRVEVARGVSERVQRRRQATAWRRAAAGPSPVAPSAAAPATARRHGAPAFSDEGRFAPRPEFTEPRNAPQARQGDAAPDVPRREQLRREQLRREQPIREQSEAMERRERSEGDGRGWPEDAPPAYGRGPRAPAPSDDGDAPSGEETWPSSRPAREPHRPRSPRAEPLSGDAPEERAAWRLGDGDRFTRGEAGRGGEQGGRQPSERAGLGRAARAARGTDRDGPGSSDATQPPQGTARNRGASRPRRWAVRADAPQRGADLGPGELVGPDEEVPPAEEVLLPEADEAEQAEQTDRADQAERTEQTERERPKLEFPDEF